MQRKKYTRGDILQQDLLNNKINHDETQPVFTHPHIHQEKAWELSPVF